MIRVTQNDLIWSAWNAPYQEIDRVAWEERERAIAQQRSESQKRAEVLLQESLSSRQREEYATKGHFTLVVKDPATGEHRHYRIRNGRHGNLDRLDSSGRLVATYCVHPTVACPSEDNMLAQKLMLESGMEEDLLRIANQFGYA